MKALIISIITLASVATLTAQSKNYYPTLKSLLSKKSHLKVYPKDTDKNVNLVSIEKGAAGLDFGSTIDQLVNLWGKPSGLMIMPYKDEWNLSIGGCRFGFIDNELVSFTIHSATIPNAKFSNGISFSSSYEEIMAAFKGLAKSSGNTYGLRTNNGYTLSLQFTPDSKNDNKLKLIAISIHHPDAGK